MHAQRGVRFDVITRTLVCIFVVCVLIEVIFMALLNRAGRVNYIGRWLDQSIQA